MPRSASIPSGLLALLGLALTIYLFNVAEAPQDRNILLGILVAEGVFITWLIWSISQPEEIDESPPIPIPLSRPFETIPNGPTRAPQPGPPYQHRPLQPSRPPSRSSDPLPPPSASPRRQVFLPLLPELESPKPGRFSARTPDPTPRTPPRPNKPSIKLGDLLPPAQPTAKPIPPPPPPRPEPSRSHHQRPKRPYRFAKFASESADSLPKDIPASDLKLCCEILSLGYACAASDGPVSSEEESHLQGWTWCVIDKTADQDAAAFLQSLGETAERSKSKGKLKLEAVAALAQSIRSTGVKTYIQSAAELCSEIVVNDGRLEPGEFATLSCAHQALGAKSTKTNKLASQLLAGDDEIKEMLSELGINSRTSTEDREAKLSVAWSRNNGRMEAVTDPVKRELLRNRMELIQRIRDLYRELDQHG